jgi:crotonobetainyl-CoA:carnitine CoA-transferase CaiB-like acyl-CoA transferase
MKIVERSDVFLTNFLPDTRRRLGIDVDEIRGVNPDIIYARGSAFGPKGSEAGKGGYDSSAFWARGGGADGVTPPGHPAALAMPCGAYGDSLSGMALAGAIAAALFGRAQSGQPSVVDVPLLGVGAWAMSLVVNGALLGGKDERPSVSANPLFGMYKTADGRWLALSLLQPGKYFEDFCEHLGRSDLIADERFSSVDALLDNAVAFAHEVRSEIAKRTLSDWIERFRTLEGPWAPVQTPYEVGMDPQLRANGLIASVVDADGTTRELVRSPALFDESPAELRRAPQFGEHTDAVLLELGYSEEEILQLKIDYVLT